ncbi:hypothetical protein HY380_00515 [Candidatus Saccharibacteria bacterium]|nr:hypothetical protein [Candidatus Saccharibacteria bacterium]
MDFTRGLKGSAKALSGLALLVLTIIGLIAYFTDSVSTSMFGALVFVLSAAVLVMSYFGWIRGRGAGLFVATAVVLLAGVMYGSQPTPKSNAYQAVFLTNGQVYFGHLENASSQHPSLTDIYYLQSNPNNPQNTSQNQQSAQNQLTLVKLGNELHGPQDEMVLKADQILFWEDLKDDGKVVQAIKNNQVKQ